MPQRGGWSNISTLLGALVTLSKKDAILPSGHLDKQLAGFTYFNA
jgi:hypothetical protein